MTHHWSEHERHHFERSRLLWDPPRLDCSIIKYERDSIDENMMQGNIKL